MPAAPAPATPRIGIGRCRPAPPASRATARGRRRRAGAGLGERASTPRTRGAIVVAIDAGHGGCLDWGVPDPSERGQALAEKTMTLGIARRLRDLLAADGIGVVMIRDEDVALAGDDYPPLGCDGPPWRDVNGDGDGRLRTRTCRRRPGRATSCRRASTSPTSPRADALVSIHINSPTEGGQRVEIAFSETFYTDETPWGADRDRAAWPRRIQAGVVDRPRPARATTSAATAASPRTTSTWSRRRCSSRPRSARIRCKQPTRGGADAGRPVRGRVDHAARRARPARLAGWPACRRRRHSSTASPPSSASAELAARIGLRRKRDRPGPEAVAGDGPPFWAPVAPEGPVALRLTNTGTGAWPPGAELVAGWEPTDQPYLARAPERARAARCRDSGAGPGESVVVSRRAARGAGRHGRWHGSRSGVDGTTLADRGSPAPPAGHRSSHEPARTPPLRTTR